MKSCITCSHFAHTFSNDPVNDPVKMYCTRGKENDDPATWPEVTHSQTCARWKESKLKHDMFIEGGMLNCVVSIKDRK